jgi:circadian clock protein KaiB
MSASRPLLYKFRLYVAGDGLNSAPALSNLAALCRTHLPQQALRDGIVMTPTLVKLAPSPQRTIVGTLSHTQTLLQAPGLPEMAA